MNRLETLAFISQQLADLHDYERACKFKHRLFVHPHSAVLPDAFIDDGLKFILEIKPKLETLERKWFFIHPNIRKDLRSQLNVFNNLKTYYDIFVSCLATSSIPILFRQGDVVPVIEQIMKEKERAEKRFLKERNKLVVKPTSLLDGFEEACKVAKDRRLIEERFHAHSVQTVRPARRPRNHRPPRPGGEEPAAR